MTFIYCNLFSICSGFFTAITITAFCYFGSLATLFGVPTTRFDAFHFISFWYRA